MPAALSSIVVTSRSSDVRAPAPTVSYPLTALPFFACAARRGIAAPRNDGGRVGMEGFFELVGELFRMNTNHSVGLSCRDFLGPIGDPELRALMRCAPTVGEALALTGELKSLFFDDVRLEVIPDGRHAALRMEFADDHHDGAMELAAGVLGGALAYVSQASGRVPDHRVVLRRAVHAKAHLQSVFGRVSAHTREDLLLVPRSVLTLRPRSANERLFGYFAVEARARSERRLWAASMREQVRAVLAKESRPLRASVASVSEALGLCSRTLQRRLAEEGTTFWRVQGSMLRQLAVEGLSKQPASAVAASLGYADASAFHRAVRGWSGLTPGALSRSVQ